MSYLKKALNYLKYLVLPLVSYLKGWLDHKRSSEIKKLRAERDQLYAKIERDKVIRNRYDRIRAAIERMSKENNVANDSESDKL